MGKKNHLSKTGPNVAELNLRRLPTSKSQTTSATSSMLERTAMSGFGLPAHVKISDLLDAYNGLQICTAIKESEGIRKVSLNLLALVFGLPQSQLESGKTSISPEQEALLDVIARSLENEGDSAIREDLYDCFDMRLKQSLIIPTLDSVNFDLYNLMEESGDFMRKAVLKRISFVAPKEGRSTIHWGQLDEFVAEQIASILLKMPVYDAKDFLANMNPKVIYLLTTSEIANYTDGGDPDRIMEIRCALEYNDSFPAACHLLSFMQQYAHEYYVKAIADINNDEYPELRSMFFNELDNRDVSEKLAEKRLWERYSATRIVEYNNNIEDIIDSIDSSENQSMP